MSFISQTISLSLTCSKLDDRLDYENNCLLENSNLSANPDNYRKIPKDQITTLIIEHAAFHNLPNVFKTFPKIVTLELNWSDLTFLDVAAIPNNTLLELLSAHQSHIHHINGSFYKKIENLKNITISDGSIGVITPEVLTGITKGRELSLIRNQIKFIPYGLFTLLSDLSEKGVNLHDNEIQSFDVSESEDVMLNAPKSPHKSNKGMLVGISLLLSFLLVACVGVVATFYFRRRQSELDFNQLLAELNTDRDSERTLQYEVPASYL